MVELPRHSSPQEQRLAGLLDTVSRASLEATCVEILKVGMKSMPMDDLRAAVMNGVENHVIAVEDAVRLLEWPVGSMNS